jgi:hypothetical protein
MIMAGDGKKKIAQMIVARFGDPAKKNADAYEQRAKEPDSGSDIDPGLLASAEEAMSAFERKDAAGFAEAMKAFCEQCDSDSDEPEQEDSGSSVLG